MEIHSSVKLARSWTNDTNADDLSSIVRLEDCLESFIKWENLDNKEMFNCKRCKKLQPADKKLDIWKLPPCLVGTKTLLTRKRPQLTLAILNSHWIHKKVSMRLEKAEMGSSP